MSDHPQSQEAVALALMQEVKNFEIPGRTTAFTRAELLQLYRECLAATTGRKPPASTSKGGA